MKRLSSAQSATTASIALGIASEREQSIFIINVVNQ